MLISFLIFIAVAALAFLVWACSNIKSGVFVKCFCSLKDASDKVVYLTFDDGPSKENTPKVLDILSRYDATATFFVVGLRTSGNEEIVLRTIAEGHQVGNHTSSHANKFPIFPYMDMLSDIANCSSLIESITGHKVWLFRPPFGVTNPRIAKCINTLGMTPVGWSIRTYDTKYPDPDKVLQRVKKKIAPGAVILLHDRLPESPVILEHLLKYLKKEGYIFNRPLPV